MLAREAIVPPNHILSLLYPELECFTGIDLKTSSPHRADIVELAAARFRLPEGLTGVEDFHFRSEGGGRAGGNRHLPAFSECRDAVAAALGEATVFVIHERQQLAVLRTRLPRWTPRLVLSAERLSRALCPRQDSHELNHLIVPLGLDGKYGLRHFGAVQSSRYRSAAAVHLLLELLHAAKERGWTLADIRFAGAINAP